MRPLTFYGMVVWLVQNEWMNESPSISVPADVFPHDRVVFFSDAVFAIAITLLAIELKPPAETLIAQFGAAGAWTHQIPLFVAFVISFMVTALFWAGHMQAWKMVERVTPGLLWLNIGQLMFVALMPFATALYSESFMSDHVAPLVGYCLVLTGIPLFSFLTRRAMVRSQGVAQKLGPIGTRWFLVRTLVPLIVFAACIPLAFILPSWMGGMLFFLIFPITPLARRWALRGHADQAGDAA